MSCAIDVLIDPDEIDVNIDVCPAPECPKISAEIDSPFLDLLIEVPYRQGIPGVPGTSFQETFETVSKNLKSWPYALNYTLDALTSIVYTQGPLSVTKTLNYSAGLLTSIVLSGDTPSGISLTKTLGYTSGKLTSITYS